MPSEQDNTAIVAIIIAVIAFFVTTAQLLQALFGTAEGYRRCQPSVIGGWSSEAQRKWRWREFRFETVGTYQSSPMPICTTRHYVMGKN